MAKFNLTISTNDGLSFTYEVRSEKPRTSVNGTDLVVSTLDGDKSFPLTSIRDWSVERVSKTRGETRLDAASADYSYYLSRLHSTQSALGIDDEQLAALLTAIEKKNKAAATLSNLERQRDYVKRNAARYAEKNKARRIAKKSGGAVVASSIEDAPIGASETLSFAPTAEATTVTSGVITATPRHIAHIEAEQKMVTVTAKSKKSSAKK